MLLLLLLLLLLWLYLLLLLFCSSALVVELLLSLAFGTGSLDFKSKIAHGQKDAMDLSSDILSVFIGTMTDVRSTHINTSTYTRTNTNTITNSFRIPTQSANMNANARIRFEFIGISVCAETFHKPAARASNSSYELDYRIRCNVIFLWINKCKWNIKNT